MEKYKAIRDIIKISESDVVEVLKFKDLQIQIQDFDFFNVFDHIYFDKKENKIYNLLIDCDDICSLLNLIEIKYNIQIPDEKCYGDFVLLEDLSEEVIEEIYFKYFD